MSSPSLLVSFPGPHRHCRDSHHPYLHTSSIFRQAVSDSQVSWDVVFPDYAPPDYTDPKSKGKEWADKEIGAAEFNPRWHEVDGDVDRRSFVSPPYRLEEGRPLNPMGRTGMKGRGILGKWGPNHAADPIVTRWKMENGVALKHVDSGRPLLQFVAILRRDTQQWAIPGGMVDPGEIVNDTLRREFGEEAFDSKQMSEEEREKHERATATLFDNGVRIYQGYVDDPRNTDNSWMETVAFNFHTDDVDTAEALELRAGDDAVGVHWMDVDKNMQLYASHTLLLEAVAKLHSAHW